MAAQDKEGDQQHVASAPELPHEIAKEFGLHHDDDHEAAEASEATAGPTAADSASPETGTADAAAPAEDAKTDAAVDDIVAKESDELLAIQDGEAGTGDHKAVHTPASKGFWAHCKRFFIHWWRNKLLRYTTIVILVGSGLATAIVPTSRYFVLNSLGVRSSASVIVVDDTTGLPLKNVSVRLGNTHAQTDVKGMARLNSVKLGPHTLAIQRLAFAREAREVTIGLGSNPLGEVELKAVGVQYVLQINDYLSGKAVPQAEATSDELNAVSDKNGRIVLTLDRTDNVNLTVTVLAPGYRPEGLKLDAAHATTTTPLSLVPAQKSIYVSKQSGTYDVYSADLDGQNAKRIMQGTGRENSNLSLVVSPDNTQAALVSTRDNMSSSDGYLLYALTFINIEQGTSVTVDHAERIQLVDWVGSRLVYRATVSGASAANAGRNRLISYNYATNARLQLATANQFNALLGVGGYIYYGASSTDPNAALGLFKIKSDGAGRERVFDKEVWTALRTDYNILKLQTPDGWYDYRLDSRQATKTDAPGTFATNVFAEDSRAQRSVWAATGDGHSTLFLREASNGKVKSLASQSGLTYPVRWAGDKAVIYRLAVSGQTADYVVSPDGGSSHKITDVVPTYGYTHIY